MARQHYEAHALAARSLCVVVNILEYLYFTCLTEPLVFTTNCKTLIPLRTVAGTLLSLDFGLFHHALAISGFCLSARYQGDMKAVLRTEALHHYTTGLNSVNSRLGDVRQRHTDGIILSIMGIAIHTLTPSVNQGWCWEVEQSITPDGASSSDQWTMHMRAIQTILAGRGGVESLRPNLTLRHWLYLLVTFHSARGEQDASLVTDIRSQNRLGRCHRP